MNNSQSYDRFSWPRIFDFHRKEHVADPSPANRKKFIAIQQGHFTYTCHKSLRSSLKQIHDFFMIHSNQCTPDERDLVISYAHNLDREQHAHGMIFRKIQSIDSYLLNLGKTDETLIKEIEHQNLVNEWNELIQDQELRNQIEAVIRLKTEKKRKEDTREHPKHPLKPTLRRELSNEIEKLDHDLKELQQFFRTKKCRRKINAFLKKIKGLDDDPPLLKQAKKQFFLEYKEGIDVLKFSQVQFPLQFSLKVVMDGSDKSAVWDEYTSFSDRKVPNRKKRIEIDIRPIAVCENEDEEVALSNRYPRIKHMETCNLRDSNELSVSKALESFLKKNDEWVQEVCYQHIRQEFAKKIESNGLKDQLFELILLQKELKEKRDQRVLADLTYPSIINPEFKKIKKIIGEKMNAFKTKEYQRQIRRVLKEIEIYQDDSRALRAAKNQLKEENLDLIKVLEKLHSQIRFATEIEINLFAGEEKLIKLQFPTNFSDRSHQTGMNGYFSRSPTDCSVNKRLEKFLEENEESFKLKVSRKSEAFDHNFLLNRREKVKCR